MERYWWARLEGHELEIGGGRGEGGPERPKGGAEAIHAHRGEAGHR